MYWSKNIFFRHHAIERLIELSYHFRLVLVSNELKEKRIKQICQYLQFAEDHLVFDMVYKSLHKDDKVFDCSQIRRDIEGSDNIVILNTINSEDNDEGLEKNVEFIGIDKFNEILIPHLRLYQQSFDQLFDTLMVLKDNGFNLE